MHIPRRLASATALGALLAWSACSGQSNDAAPAAVATAPTPPPSTTPPSPTMPAANSQSPAPAAREIATFGGGCFWCTEAVLETVDGVIDVMSGYAGGTVDNPTYKQVCTGATGHAEVVQVTFDPAKIAYDDLLDWFFKAHDPTTLNAQGPDHGTQYRSVVFYHSDAQQKAALAAIERAQKDHAARIVTEVTPAPRFWPAEDYHQDYFRLNGSQPYCRAMIAPKLKKLGLDGKKK